MPASRTNLFMHARIHSFAPVRIVVCMWEEADRNVHVLFSLYEKQLVDYEADVAAFQTDQTYLTALSERANEEGADDVQFAALGLDFRLDEIQRSLRRIKQTEAAVDFWLKKSEIAFEADLYRIQEFAENRVEAKIKAMEEDLARSWLRGQRLQQERDDLQDRTRQLRRKIMDQDRPEVPAAALVPPASDDEQMSERQPTSFKPASGIAARVMFSKARESSYQG